MNNLYAPASEQQLQSLERELGKPLPAGYRAFLKSRNGERFSSAIRCAAKHDPKIDVDLAVIVIYGIGSVGDQYNLLDAQNDYDFNSRVPDNIICIAEASHRLRICISLDGDDQGKIYLWIPIEDWVEDDVESSYEELSIIFDSFEDFLNSLG